VNGWNEEKEIRERNRFVQRAKVFQKARTFSTGQRKRLSEMGKRGAESRRHRLEELRQQDLTQGDGFDGDEYWQK